MTPDPNPRVAERLRELARRIPRETADVRQAIKREAWSRGVSIERLAPMVPTNPDHLRACLSHGARAKPGRLLTPRLVDRIAAALLVGEERRRELHRLGALASGWRIE